MTCAPGITAGGSSPVTAATGSRRSTAASSSSVTGAIGQTWKNGCRLRSPENGEKRVRDGDWIILRTSGPSTLRLMASLQEAGVAAWTPTERVRRRLPRSAAVEYRSAALAPTYVFAKKAHLDGLRKVERADITPHPRFSIFRYYGETVYVRHTELHALRRLQQDSYLASLPRSGKGPMKPRGVAYNTGDPVTFSEGPLAGLKCFVEISDGLTTNLCLTLFGRMSTVKVPTLQLRAADVSQMEPAA